jgi:hypothetical protein
MGSCRLDHNWRSTFKTSAQFYQPTLPNVPRYTSFPSPCHVSLKPHLHIPFSQRLFEHYVSIYTSIIGLYLFDWSKGQQLLMKFNPCSSVLLHWLVKIRFNWSKRYRTQRRTKHMLVHTAVWIMTLQKLLQFNLRLFLWCCLYIDYTVDGRWSIRRIKFNTVNLKDSEKNPSVAHHT